MLAGTSSFAVPAIRTRYFKSPPLMTFPEFHQRPGAIFFADGDFHAVTRVSTSAIQMVFIQRSTVRNRAAG